ncbi:hypothetical protein M3Y99_00284500 [Aphelenchoides fujianensis]|nr:hypothetical protein M3Y99_00284500 [Aphelenchoides fujianensis]
MSTKQRGFVLCVEEQAGHRMASVFLKSKPADEVLLVREAEYEAALTPGNIVDLVPPPILQPDFLVSFPKERVEDGGLTQVLFKCHALLTDDPADDAALESPKVRRIPPASAPIPPPSFRRRPSASSLDFGRFVITRDTQLPADFRVHKDRLYAVWVGSHPRRQPESRLRRFGTILLAGRIEEAAQDVAKANAIREACDVVCMGLVVGEQAGVHDFFLPEGRIERVRLEGDVEVGRLYVAALRKPTDGVGEGAIVARCHQPPTRRVDGNLIEATLECAVQPRPAAQTDARWSHWGTLRRWAASSSPARCWPTSGCRRPC